MYALYVCLWLDECICKSVCLCVFMFVPFSVPSWYPERFHYHKLSFKIAIVPVIQRGFSLRIFRALYTVFNFLSHLSLMQATGLPELHRQSIPFLRGHPMELNWGREYVDRQFYSSRMFARMSQHRVSVAAAYCTVHLYR